MTPDDRDLSLLWRSGGASADPDAVSAAVRREIRLQRRIRRYVLGLSVLIFLVMLWMDIQGAFAVKALMPGMVALAIAYDVFQTGRKRRRLPAISTLGPEALVRHAIARARATLRTARFFYAVAPASVLVGLGLAPLLSAEAPDFAGPRALTLALAALPVIGIAAGAVFGLHLAREKKAEIAALQTRLQEFRGEL